MKGVLFILFTFFSSQLFAQTFSDTTILKQFVGRWNVANNYKYTAWQNEQYTSMLLFYGKTIEKSKAIETKIFFFKKNKSYHQEIVSPIEFSFYKSGVVKCSFDKKGYYGSYTKDYPAYLLFIKQNGVYKISGESDLISDANAGFTLKLGEEIIPNSSKSNMLFVWLATGSGVIVIIYILIKRKTFRPNISGSKTYTNALVRNTNIKETGQEEKGIEFEKYVVKLFKQPHFVINEWRGDKYVEGIYAKSTMNPDLEINYRDSIHDIIFAVECKYKSYLLSNVTICKDYQLKNYRSFQQTRKIPVFIVLGAGGIASEPNEMFIIPLNDLAYHEVSKRFIQLYKRRNAANPFYFDAQAKMVK